MATTFLEPTANAELVSRLFRLMPDTPGRWGIMTVGQMLVHCTDQLRVSLGEKHALPVRIPGFLRPLLKRFFLQRLQSFKPNMKTLPGLDSRRGMTRPTTFATDHATLLAYLRPERYPAAGVEHPLFGHLSTRELGEITWKHLDHHLRQFGV
ncbi:MAG: DUF1569 domain-containing protein [Hymenobacter sp.]|nr:MAG: DUF1569 domain-containing protein [Hymenobacter sp.]